MEARKMITKYDIEIKDTVFDPYLEGNKVHIHGKDSQKPMYKVWIYLDGSDVYHVNKVTYHLHKSFGSFTPKEVKRTVSNPNCTIVIWTWGIFTIRALVEFKNGKIYEFVYPLHYGDQLRNKKNYEEV